MKNTSHLKYIEWRDPEGLHSDTLQSISEIEFLKDELKFLSGLIAGHTLEIIYGKSFEEARQISIELSKHEQVLPELLKELRNHLNTLQILLDEVDVPNELAQYKNSHYQLMMKIMDLHAAIKKTKRSIFKMIAEVIKKKKRKRI